MKPAEFHNLPSWLYSNVFYRTELKSGSDKTFDEKAEQIEVHPYDANLISSERMDGRHILMLDLDLQTHVVESSSPGHKHLYVNTSLTKEALAEIVDVLAKHGIIQQGIKQQMDKRGHLALRPPGVKKGSNDDLGLEDAKALKDDPALVDEPITDLNLDKMDEPFKLLNKLFQSDLQQNYSAPEAQLSPTFAKGGLVKNSPIKMELEMLAEDFGYSKFSPMTSDQELRVSVPLQQVNTYISRLIYLLGLDDVKITTDYSVAFDADTKTVTVQGNLLCRVEYNVYGWDSEAILVFRKSNFETFDPVPKNWPSWSGIISAAKESI
jgi:hypothetical protein